MSLLMEQPIEHSLKLLSINNIPLRQYRRLENHLVPNKLTASEFEQLASRLNAHIAQVEEAKKQRAAAKMRSKQSRNPVKRTGTKVNPGIANLTIRNAQYRGNQHLTPLRKISLKTSDFVVCVNKWRCLKNPVHSIENIQALIPIVSNGEIMNLALSGGYCARCNQYFILSEHFKMNRHRLEQALCTILDIPAFHKYCKGEGFSKWSPESVLMKMGYSVAVGKDPGQVRRIDILKRVIEGEAMTKLGVMNHINAQIDLRKANPSMTLAIAKWRSDLETISKMSFGKIQRKVIVGMIRNATGN